MFLLLGKNRAIHLPTKRCAFGWSLLAHLDKKARQGESLSDTFSKNSCSCFPNINHKQTKKMRRLFYCLLFLSATVYAQDGFSDQTFNESFLHQLKLGMPYHEVVKLAGGPGAPGQNVHGSIRSYVWIGQHSVLDIKTDHGKVVRAVVTDPDDAFYLDAQTSH